VRALSALQSCYPFAEKFELLSNDAAKARGILSRYSPAMTKEEYLELQTSVFKTELYDGTA
jgi:hypothetical protein